MAGRRKSAGNPVSLFPFLAVLLCTMGSLIFLLLVTTDRVRKNTAEVETPHALPSEIAPPVAALEPLLAVVPPEPIEIPPAPLPSVVAAPIPVVPVGPTDEERVQRMAEQQQLNEQWMQRAAELQANRAQQNKAVLQQALLLKATQQRVSQIEAELARLDGALDNTAEQLAGGISIEQQAADRELIVRQIASLKKRLDETKTQAQSANSRYAVIPFDSHSGTTRRPIYIICTDEAITFLPENVSLSPSDLRGFTERYNPLLAGTVALSQYWANQPLPPGTNPQDAAPYVLLLVKPSGTVAYYIAQQYLSSLKQAHGYELIPEDLPLDLPLPESGAVTACRTAVDRVLGQRRELMTSTGRGAFPGGGSPIPSGVRQPGGIGQSGGSRPGGGQAGTAPNSEGQAPRRFDLESLGMGDGAGGSIGERSWERIDRFQGRPPTVSATQPAGVTRGVPSTNPYSPEGERSESGNGMRRGQVIELGTGRVTNSTAADEQGTAANLAGLEGNSAEPLAGRVEETSPSRGQAGSSAARHLSPPESSFNNTANGATGAGNRFDGQTEPSQNPGTMRQLPTFGPRSKGKLTEQEALRIEDLQRRKWGLSPQNAIIGFERSVTVQIDADRAIVANRVVPLGNGESATEAFFQLMMTLDEETRSWGPPPDGFYWRPSLKFVISPGGNQHFARLEPLANKSGLVSSRVMTLEPTTSPTARKP